MAEKFTVLIADDQLANRELLRGQMLELGLVPMLAENGLEVLAEVRHCPPDLILLDMMMPAMNGFQVLETLKADSRSRHIPVIIISAVDDMEMIVDCIKLGAEDYLVKPFKKELLRARIQGALDRLSFARKEQSLRDQLDSYLLQLRDAKRRSDELLHAILPKEKVEELKATNEVKPQRYDNVAVLFCDIVNFTSYCDSREPEVVVSHLQELVSAFESIVSLHGLEKIKTIGDAFMATAGLLKPVDRPVLSCVRCGLEMISAASNCAGHWEVRVGVHVGPVLAGVVGTMKYLFDLWGDTVNTAARVESHGLPGAVCLSARAWEQVADICRGESMGLMNVKGKGDLEVFRVEGFLVQ